MKARVMALNIMMGAASLAQSFKDGKNKSSLKTCPTMVQLKVLMQTPKNGYNLAELRC